MSERLRPELDDFTNRVNKYAQFDAPFVMDGSTIAGRFWGDVPGVHAPSVYHDPDGDITIEGDGWLAMTGLTGQYGYNGAVMHSSEFIGSRIAEAMSDLSDSTPQVFVVVVVESDVDGEEPAGWAILYQEADPKMFQCAFPA